MYFAGLIAPTECIDRHQPARVKLEATEKSYKYVVGGCYYADNTNNELIERYIQSALRKVESVQEQVQSNKQESCANFASRKNCTSAFLTCSRIYPRSRVRSYSSLSVQPSLPLGETIGNQLLYQNN